MYNYEGYFLLDSLAVAPRGPPLALGLSGEMGHVSALLVLLARFSLLRRFTALNALATACVWREING